MSEQPIFDELERDHPTFTCPVCRRRSWHPEDVANEYCGACNAFTGQVEVCAEGTRS